MEISLIGEKAIANFGRWAIAFVFWQSAVLGTRHSNEFSFAANKISRQAD
ncbi:hypothetical protein LC605_30765 [Nostoc sp. CHAB 5836]|nr:hypothetical protein [Nostoc sp. CHAB 5836]MCC5619371.1 hypothetical protein [Nostoc sp. CHAB 5836]